MSRDPRYDWKAYERFRRERHPDRNKLYYRDLRSAVFKKFGNRCNNPGCGWINVDGSHGCADIRCLQLDHVNDDGYTERKTVSMWTIWKRALLDLDGRYQLLCANCNWIKKAVKEEK